MAMGCLHFSVVAFHSFKFADAVALLGGVALNESSSRSLLDVRAALAPGEARLSLSCHRHVTLYSLPLPAYRYAPRQCQED